MLALENIVLSNGSDTALPQYIDNDYGNYMARFHTSPIFRLDRIACVYQGISLK